MGVHSCTAAHTHQSTRTLALCMHDRPHASPVYTNEQITYRVYCCTPIRKHIHRSLLSSAEQNAIHTCLWPIDHHSFFCISAHCRYEWVADLIIIRKHTHTVRRAFARIEWRSTGKKNNCHEHKQMAQPTARVKIKLYTWTVEQHFDDAQRRNANSRAVIRRRSSDTRREHFCLHTNW